MKKKKRSKLKRSKLVALSLAAIMAVSIGTVSASAMTLSQGDMVYSKRDSFWNNFFNQNIESEYEDSAINLTRNYKSLATVSNKSVSSYKRKSVSVNGKVASVKGITINGIEYIPFRQTANLFGAAYNYNSSSATSTMSLSGLTVTATSGNYVIYANGRVLFSVSPTLIMSDGRMYIPAATFAKAVGMKLTSTATASSFTGSYSPLKSAENYYRSDEVLWLARIIHAESRGEPLLGQIAVGNVVLNRVKSKDYPNTIYGVIFDKKYGVQFSPVIDGSIYNTPSYNSVLAAKICLEGFDTSEGAFFFLRPEMSTSSWIPNNRPYLFSIGKHDFYK